MNNNSNNDLNEAKKILSDGNYTCVLYKDNVVYTSKERGVKPLLEFINNYTCLKDFSAADKVVGKGAAFLYVLLKVKAVYAEIISKPALKILEEHGIEVFCKDTVTAIKNRSGDGFCPIESAVLNIENPSEALNIIKATLKKLSS